MHAQKEHMSNHGLPESHPRLKISLSIDNFAKVCYECEYAYNAALSEETSEEATHQLVKQARWVDISEQEKIDYKEYIFYLTRRKTVNAAHAQELFLSKHLRKGYRYAKVTNKETKQHSSLLPYNDLPIVTQQKLEFVFDLCKSLNSINKKEGQFENKFGM